MKRLLSLVMASLLFFSLAPEFASANSPTSLMSTARDYLGTPYRLGGTTPTAFDCSGYTQYVFKKEGLSIPRTTGQQMATGTPVSKSNLEVGDLVFFNTSGRGVSHVGIYSGSNNFIHASVSKGVMVSSLDDPYYWKSRYIGARRVADFSETAPKEEKQVAASAPVKEIVYATRGEVAQVLAEKLELDMTTVNIAFKDVDESNPHYHAISAVAEANIFTGDGGNFNPDKELTRAQLAKVLVGAFELRGSAIANFSDVPKGHWATEYINILFHHKITTGYLDGTFGIADKVSVGQLNKFIDRINN
ncbi:endopeptidase Spr precursor [Sporosarcina sp. P37]|uniref:C40 family peptidase n=1 Tax=unclassified Sporosarcina TaxID=2647733 RepID=UPI0009BF7884|nr:MULTISPECIES: C40 family peptidase [unclassified Sporosarcina]ARD48991.1 endopeptidase Spr precursor [Sporosarcina sp. P33]ARK25470.1 endopeptidase Spr precursor [Sporosarcina sp. P37]PID18000.1 endopeptidase Spr precursor [Sporosarcina sp. P35]